MQSLIARLNYGSQYHKLESLPVDEMYIDREFMGVSMQYGHCLTCGLNVACWVYLFQKYSLLLKVDELKLLN